ncbi:uncharacterized protein LOC144923513 [Branchiostoma floridae x Branchiostoma belcheri]
MIAMAILTSSVTLTLTLWHISTPHLDVDTVLEMVLRDLQTHSQTNGESTLEEHHQTLEAALSPLETQLATVESCAAQVSRLQNRVSTLLQDQLDQERTLRSQLANITAVCKAAPDRGKVFHLTSPEGRYRYDLDEARQACAENGAVLATYDQLREAWQGGLQRCDCGWLSDGTAYYPMQESRQDCANTRGVVRCDWQLTQNAWCFRSVCQ